jgi:hypothetical protein
MRVQAGPSIRIEAAFFFPIRLGSPRRLTSMPANLGKGDISTRFCGNKYRRNENKKGNPMKSLAGAIVVLAGAMIFTFGDVSYQGGQLTTLMMVIGLLIIGLDFFVEWKKNKS